MKKQSEPCILERLADAFDSMLHQWFVDGVPATDDQGRPVLDDQGKPKRRPMKARELNLLRKRLADCGVPWRGGHGLSLTPAHEDD